MDEQTHKITGIRGGGTMMPPSGRGPGGRRVTMAPRGMRQAGGGELAGGVLPGASLPLPAPQSAKIASQ
jgi:hypothetical protein